VEGVGIGVDAVACAEEESPIAAWQWNQPAVGRNVADAGVGNCRGIVESVDWAQIGEVDAVGGGIRALAAKKVRLDSPGRKS